MTHEGHNHAMHTPPRSPAGAPFAGSPFDLHGRVALGLIMAGWPQLLQNRAPVAALSDIAAPPDVQRGLWFDLKKVLLKEVAPSWAPCFD